MCIRDRFHMDAAEFRLKSVHSLLAALKSDLCERQEAAHPYTYSLAVSNLKVQEVYWDFESFLSEVSIALDLLARDWAGLYPRISTFVQQALQMERKPPLNRP